MDKFLWLCFIVPVIAAGMVLHFKMKGQVKAAGYDQHSGSVTLGQQMWYIIPKCLSTWMAVFTAAAGLWQQKTDTYEHAWWILAALILFMAADAFLEIKFYIGMAVFAAGHIILIAWIFSFGYFNIAGTLIIWCLLIAAALVLFKKELVQFKEHPIQYLMMLYPAVLAAIIAAAVLMPQAMGTDFMPLAIGMILFGISDMLVGKNFFSPLGKGMNYVILILYYSGIECIALMTWM